MKRRLAAILFGLSVMGTTLPLSGADGLDEKGPKQSFEVTSTERVPFLPGGTIRLERSYGYLTVEGWDEPEVEVTVTKSTDRFYGPEHKDKAEKPFDQIRVVTERRSDKEWVTSTATPARNSLFTSVLPSGQIILTWPLPPNNKRGVTVEYIVHVPRDSRLVVHHDNGYVWVSDVTGDIEVNSHTGDMIVMLPDPGPYSIDARTRLGRVSSDLTGNVKILSQFLVGSHFAYASQAGARRIYLRMGRGSITIKNGPPSGPFWKD
ncbi:exported hypothetical protein [Candidatus Sulfotelmatomonas gaucii]|uniref:Adhesin domain-containing protein n=1 Tax=Candidatus Sulfuritelmatomonas gaucii TaxID=2043161 RepID=A0A2N9M757_9BACT|nr:exported hypothetical protein [Candidatus Sulfotelmatomonas gaucii]